MTKIILQLFLYCILFTTVLSAFNTPSAYESNWPFHNGVDIVYDFRVENSYFTNWTFVINNTIPRTDISITFDCVIIGDIRRCTLKSNQPYSRFVGTLFNSYCAINAAGNETSCGHRVRLFSSPPRATNIKTIKRPPTSGGDAVITGDFLRMNAYYYNSLYKNYDLNFIFYPIKGNVLDPSFNCNNLTVTFPPGSGRLNVKVDDTMNEGYNIYYAAPTIDNNKCKYDSSKQVLTLIGDNFSVNKSKIYIKFDGTNVTNDDFSLITNHTQIELYKISRIYGGQAPIEIIVDNITMDYAHNYCFKPIPTSSTSVSKYSGGIVTIKGSLFATPTSTSNNVTIKIGDNNCTFIESTSTEIKCSLSPLNEDNGSSDIEVKLSGLKITISIDGCFNTDNNSLFSFNLPTINNITISTSNSRIVSLTGSLFGKSNDTIVYLLNGNIDGIKPNSINNENNLEFELPLLKCKNNNLQIKTFNNPSNSKDFEAKLVVIPIQSPLVSDGTGLSLNLHYLKCPIAASISSPTAIIDGNSNSIKSCSKPEMKLDSIFYSTICNISAGTGKHSVSITYDGETYTTPFSYAAPFVKNMTISNDTITIIGINFGTNSSLFSAVYLNRTVELIGSITNTEFKFKFNENDTNGLIDITVDGISNEFDFKIELLPKNIILDTNQKIKTHNATISLKGNNLLSKDPNKKGQTYPYYVKVTVNDKLCSILISNSTDDEIILSIPDEFKPPFTKNITVYINDIVVPGLDDVILYYKSPSIINVTSSNSEVGNFVNIQIIGSNFANEYFTVTIKDQPQMKFTCTLLLSDKYDCNGDLNNLIPDKNNNIILLTVGDQTVQHDHIKNLLAVVEGSSYSDINGEGNTANTVLSFNCLLSVISIIITSCLSF